MSQNEARNIEMRRLDPIAFAIALALAAAGCATPSGQFTASEVTPDRGTSLVAHVPADKLNTVTRKVAAEGLRAMDAGDWRKASELFNLALKTDVGNSSLQLLNAQAYHQRARHGESSLQPLAEEGYELAIQFDSSNWMAYYFHGLLAMEKRDFQKAQRKFAAAAIYADKDRDLLYDLAVASYYAQDPKTAAAALEGLRRLQDGKGDARTLRASAIVAASLNEMDSARNHLDALRKTSTQASEVALVEERLRNWQASHEREAIRLAQFVPGTSIPGAPSGQQGFVPPAVTPVIPVVPVMPGTPAAPGVPPQGQPGIPGARSPAFPVAPIAPARGPVDFVEKNMASIDVVIIQTEEDINNRMGINLLDGLRLQFGNLDTRTPGYSSQRNRTDDRLNPLNSIATDVVTRLITLPAVSYTLNIANAADRRNYVLARPTLVALGGQTSQFFSGVDVNAAAVSGGQGAPVQITKEVGVKLAVTPDFLPDGLVRLQVLAERTFLTNPSANVVFDFRLDTTKTIVSANVVMRFGETLILSGLSERDTSGDRSAVPVIGDIPVLQYLFSQRADRDYFKSVLILLTPRRPQYTYRDSAVAQAELANLSGHDRAVEEFERKYRDLFQPIPNSAAIVRHLREGSLYREFRTGDLAMGDWNARRNFSERMKSVVDFLYY